MALSMPIPIKRRQQMLGGRDQHALLHQAGGVADAGYVAPAGFDFETVQVGATENDPGPGGRREDLQIDWSPAMETSSTAGDCSTNCLFMRQRENDVSLLL